MTMNKTPVPKRTNAEKMRRAARHSHRPGAECKAPPRKFAPIVDHGRCEAKGDCVEVCPYNVFEVTPIADADYRALSWLGRLRVKAHGMQTAYTPRADLCLACGMCVVACPEWRGRLGRKAVGPIGRTKPKGRPDSLPASRQAALQGASPLLFSLVLDLASRRECSKESRQPCRLGYDPAIQATVKSPQRPAEREPSFHQGALE